MDPVLKQGLLKIYEDLASDIAQLAPVCEVSGRCCRFEEYGHRLYLTSPESELLLSEGLPAGAEINTATCPFQIEKLCTAREKRPLGCRVFFCDPSYAGHAEALTEKYLARLKNLHQATGTDWVYASLHHFLVNRQVTFATDDF